MLAVFLKNRHGISSGVREVVFLRSLMASIISPVVITKEGIFKKLVFQEGSLGQLDESLFINILEKASSKCLPCQVD